MTPKGASEVEEQGRTAHVADRPGAGAAVDGGFLPRRRRDDESRWWVLHTRSRQEKSLAAFLGGAGVSCWLPLRGGRLRVAAPPAGPAPRSLPLYPGYVFLWGDRDEVFLADRTRRVANVIPVPGQGELEWELSNLWRALDRGALLPDSHASLPEGVRVRVLSGPFEGVEGTVLGRRGADRLLLQVRMLSTATSLDIRDEIVEPIGP